MKKWHIALGGLGALLVGAAAALLVSIDPIVEAGVNKFGPEITGTHVFLKKADLSLFSGQGSLQGITVGNPKGFASPHAVKMGSVDVALDTSTLLDDVIVIKRIAVDSPDIVYEIAGKTNNFDEILRNVKRLGDVSEKTAAKKEASGGKAEGTARKVVIDEFVITNGKASVRLPALKADLTVSLPEMSIEGIGREDGKTGISMAKAAERILRELSSSLGKASSKAVSDARVSLTIGGEGIGKVAKDVGAALKGLFGK